MVQRFELLAERELLAADLDLPGLTEQRSAPQHLDQVPASQNVAAPADVNADQHISVADGLLLVNAINRILDEPMTMPPSEPYLDVSGDGLLTPDDFDEFASLINETAWVAGVHVSGQSSGVCDEDCSDPGVDDTPPDLEDSGADGGDDVGGPTGGNDPADDSGDVPDSGGGDSGSTADTPTEDPDGGEPSGGSGGDSGDSGDDAGGDNSTGGTTPTNGTPGGSTPSGPNDSSNTDYGTGDDSSPSGSSSQDYTGMQCNNSLQGATVDEGQKFTLGLVVDPNCVMSYSVDWGDGIREVHHPHQQAVHVYDDDATLNTPADDYTVLVVLQMIDGSQTPLQTTVTVKNVTPRAVDDQYSTNEDTPLLITDAVWNDNEPSFEDTLSIVSKIDTTGTIGKVINRGDGTFRYDPQGQFDCLAEGETATDSFKYTIHDDDEPGVETTATVTITVHGRPEFYLLAYGGGPHANEEGETPANAFFSISPAPKCGPITIEYERVDEAGPLSLPMASDSDVKQASGTVTFGQGVSSVQTTITPVDDEIIEPDEWFYFAVAPVDNADYRIHATTEHGYFKINDNEWRFVTEAKSVARTIGPDTVEAFSTFYASSVLSGSYSMKSTIEPGLGNTADSTALVRADIAGLLTRPGNPTNRTDDYVQVQFHCDSQTGDVWRTAIQHDGQRNDSPLSTTVGMEYLINDIGDEEAIVVVDLDFEFLAGGEIRKAISPGLDIQIGDRSKATASGFITLEKHLIYAGGVERSVGDGFVLRCQKGG